MRLHRWRGQELLVVDLLPGVDAHTPCVVGLDHPDVQRMMSKRLHGATGLRTATRILDQPPSAIDHAAAYFTGGRVRVH
ncbi:hypothetical protein [Nocardia sp. NPDC052566]|uniref:hypothetical protein n=1 Tax=Nocardia sp. NPDC052566 TaxID=3364330 RepID=UPI0037C9E05D